MGNRRQYATQRNAPKGPSLDQEYVIQRAAVNRLRTAMALLPKGELRFFHVPNELHGHLKTWGARMATKRSGVEPGVPDLVIIFRGVHYYLELKSNLGHLSTSQREWGDFFQKWDIRWAVTYGMEDMLLRLETWGIP